MKTALKDLNELGYSCSFDRSNNRLLLVSLSESASKFSTTDIIEPVEFVLQLRQGLLGRSDVLVNHIASRLPALVRAIIKLIPPEQVTSSDLLRLLAQSLRHQLNRRAFSFPHYTGGVDLKCSTSSSSFDSSLVQRNHALLAQAFQGLLKSPIPCGEVSSGMSFWLQRHDDLWLLGLWSGLVYTIGPRYSVYDIVSGMLDGEYLPEDKLVTAIPEDCRRSLDLRECCEAYVVPSSAENEIGAASAIVTFESASSRLSPYIRDLTSGSKCVLTVVFGTAKCHLLFVVHQKASRLESILFEKEPGTTSDRTTLVAIVSRGLNTQLYDVCDSLGLSDTGGALATGEPGSEE